MPKQNLSIEALEMVNPDHVDAWPTIIVHDFYNHLANAKADPYVLEMLCDIEVPDGSVKQRTFEQKIQVESCDPGFQLERGRCQQCKLRTYSIHGFMCFACPTGANCVIEEIINGGSSEKGVPYPRTMAGYYLGDAPESQLPKLCIRVMAESPKRELIVSTIAPQDRCSIYKISIDHDKTHQPIFLNG